MERLQRNAVPVLLGAALVSAAVLTLLLTAQATYFGDEWGILMNRRELGLDTLLEPHNEHIVVFPALIDHLLLQLFGMESARPAQLVLIAFLLATAVLLFVYVRRRVGPWPALLATVLVLFLGPAWEVLLWPFEITLVGPVMFGLAMLLALEREDRRGDLVALVCLTLAVGFSNLGIVFVPAAAAAILVGPREAWLRRSYVFVIPGALFALWSLGWGGEAESHLSLRNVLAAPQSVLDSAAVAVGSLTGLAIDLSTGVVDLTWGRILLVVLALAIVRWKVSERGPVERWLWPVAAAILVAWLLTAFNLSPGRDPTSSRYQYSSCILLLMALAGLFRGVRIGPAGLVALTVLTGLALGPNLVMLKNGSTHFEQQAVLSRAGTAAIEIARDSVDPEFQLDPEVAGEAAAEKAAGILDRDAGEVRHRARAPRRGRGPRHRRRGRDRSRAGRDRRTARRVRAPPP